MKLMEEAAVIIQQRFTPYANYDLEVHGVVVIKNDIVHLINEKGEWDLLRNGKKGIACILKVLDILYKGT